MGKKDEWKRGAKDARQQIEVLRARWPKSFPAKASEIRPLADATAVIAAELGWSTQYTKGVLSVWKAREAYCLAVLKYSVRTSLLHEDKANVIDAYLAEYNRVVGSEAFVAAKTRLEQIAASRKRKRAKQVAERAAPAGVDLEIEADGQTGFIQTKVASLLATPHHTSGPATAVEPAPVDAPPALPLDELPRERKLIVASSAAKEALLKRAGGAMTTEVVATIPPRRR
jgi:hypothetical protein